MLTPAGGHSFFRVRYILQGYSVLRSAKLRSTKITKPLSLYISLLLSFSLFQLSVPVSADAEENRSFLIHGGGVANISCPEGSSIQADVAFVAVENRNATLSGNWTIDSQGSISSSANSLNDGLIYRGNLSTAKFSLEGEIDAPDQQINLCNVPIFAPISLTGECGENVTVTLAFQSDDPLDITDTFPADVICQPLDAQ